MLTLDQRRVEIGRGEGTGIDQPPQEAHVAGHAADAAVRERLAQAGARLLAIAAVHDQLGE